MNQQDVELAALAPDAVIMNYLRPTNERLVRALLEAGTTVIVLDTEGGVMSSIDAYGGTLARDRDVRHAVAAYCSWGPLVAGEAMQRDWFTPSQVVVTGAPRFDFYHPSLVDAARAASPHAAAVGSPQVLFNGNFPVVNPRFQSPQDEARDLVKRFGWSEQAVRDWQSTQQESLRGLVNAFNSCVARFPAVQFVYRPHPFEKESTYRTLLAPAANAHLVKRGSVDGWILRSAAVVQRSCTTAIEAALASRPALSPSWVPTSAVMEAAEAVSIACEDESALHDAIDAAARGDLALPPLVIAALDATIANWFHAIDGRSHERVADVVGERLQASGRRPNGGAGLGAGFAGSSATSRARWLVKRLLPPGARAVVRRGPARRAALLEKRFSVADVRSMASAIAPALGVAAGDVHVGRVRPGLRVLPFPQSVRLRVARS